MSHARTVIITGASTGIGRACALHLAGAGWKVYAGVRKEEDAASLREEDHRVTPLFIDVTDRASIESARETFEKENGPHLDALVNNAGIVVHGPLEFVTPDELRAQFDVNVVGMVATTQVFLPPLRASQGRIVNMGSVAGRSPAIPLLGPYSASKWAVEAITDAMRNELRPFGIHVAVIEPGNISTPIWDKAEERFERLPAEARALYRDLIETGQEINAFMDRTGVPARKVADAVEHALTSRRPRLRYLVGIDAHWRAYVEGRIPHRVRDKVIGAVMKRGLPAFLKK
ncbi:MAG: SDR family oxidoreductase [Actinobacteria bacterium]|nr:SDR family oxidoreductase [Actinomycetota bacterium]